MRDACAKAWDETHWQVSRREFLKVSVAGVAVGGCSTVMTEENRDCRRKCDVLVVGGGPSGVCAALAAVRNGARTLLVESGNCLGGMATQGLVGPFMTCYDKSGKVQVVRGLFEEIVSRLVSIGGAIHPREVRAGTEYTAWIERGHDHVTPFDVDALKFVLDDFCAEAGVEVLYHANFVRPLVNGNRINGVEILTKGGIETVAASVVIDATGDGDVAFRVGVPCASRDSGRTWAMQPCTTFFRIENLPLETVLAHRAAHPGERLFASYVSAARASGKWTIPRPHVNLYKTPRVGEWFANVSRLNGVDATDPQALSDAETLGRRQVRKVMHFLRKYISKDVRLSAVASTLGVRETRHVLGDCVMTKEDILEGRVPADAVALNAYSIDLHGGKGASGTLFLTMEKGEYYGVPYRALMPKGSLSPDGASRPRLSPLLLCAWCHVRWQLAKRPERRRPCPSSAAFRRVNFQQKSCVCVCVNGGRIWDERVREGEGGVRFSAIGVAAGFVVVDDVPDDMFVVGNPAQIKRDLS